MKKKFALVVTTIVVATALASAQTTAGLSKGMRGSYVFFVVDAENPGAQTDFDVSYNFPGIPNKTIHLKKGHSSVHKFVQTPMKSRNEVGGTIWQEDLEKLTVTYVSEDGKAEEYPLPVDFKVLFKPPVMFPIPTSVQHFLRKLPEREKVAGHWCDVYEANVADNYGKVWKLADNPDITMKTIAKIGSRIYFLQATTFEQDVEISDSEFALPSSAKKSP